MVHLKEKEEEALAKVEDLTAKNKSLEQENLAKEQEITSLAHKNQLLEGEVEKLEKNIKDLKTSAEESNQSNATNESLQRRLQLLEEEAEQADVNLRETNEKYVCSRALFHSTPDFFPPAFVHADQNAVSGFAKPMSKPVTTNVKCKL